MATTQLPPGGVVPTPRLWVVATPGGQWYPWGDHGRYTPTRRPTVFPEVVANTDARPAACPRCRRAGMGRHRAQTRPVVDLKVSQAQVVRYQCEGCGASLTVTRPGLQPGCKHSDCAKVMSVVLWGLGLSFRDAVSVMKTLGVPVSHVEIILNVRETVARAMARQRKAALR